MDKYSFYKSLYDRELSRRKDLDGAVSLPITILTLIVAANSYTLKNQHAIYSKSDLEIKHLVSVLLLVTLFISVFYIMRSSNNLFKGFAYKNFALIKDIRVYEEQLNAFNNTVPPEKSVEFEGIILAKLADFTDSHIIFNDRRSKDLYSARTYLIISLILTGINFLILTFNYIKL